MARRRSHPTLITQALRMELQIFSLELRLSIQIFCDFSVKEGGFAGLGWETPRLESSAIAEKGGAIWTAP